MRILSETERWLSIKNGPQGPFFLCSIQFAVDFFNAVTVEWYEIVDKQALLAIVDGVGEFRDLGFGHTVGAQRFFLHKVVEQVFKFVIDFVGVAFQDVGDARVQHSNFAILADFHVVAHDAGEHGVVRFSMRHVEGAAEGIAQRVHSGAASVGESHAGVGAGEEKIFEQWLTGFRSFGDDGFEAGEDEIDGFVAEELAEGRGFWRERRFHSMDEGVDGAGGKWFHRQAFEQFGDEHGVVREHGRIAVAGFRAAADERECSDAGDFAVPQVVGTSTSERTF